MTDGGALASLLPGAADTIVAVATPAGRGALGIVRVSGPGAHEIGRTLLDRWPERPRQAQLTHVRDRSGIALDQAMVVRYDAPASFTGEHAFELTTHGGVVVPTTVVAAIIERGARLALPGEFTRRAVLNGKLDILQAEATADLIAAGSRGAQRVAVQQLDGGLSRRIAALREEVIGIEALIAYDIDFPEEDDGPISRERVLGALDALETALGSLLATARGGELVRDGALVVLAGAPNVGKSSLFNALLGRSRAIVTPVPGTTRDALEALVEAEPWPIRLVDTAGLRRTDDPVERLGIEMSEFYLARADVVLCCGDSAGALRAAHRAVRAAGLVSGNAAPIVVARTKSDLGETLVGDRTSITGELGAAEYVEVSADTGAGVQQLLKLLGDVLARRVGGLDLDAPVLTQARHLNAVDGALREVGAFRRAWIEELLPATIAAVHLHAAAASLHDLIGGIDTEQLLDEVFRRFCVGK
jgi:tRNA modification GTPase